MQSGKVSARSTNLLSSGVGVVEHVDEPDPASLLAGWKDYTGAFPDIHNLSQDFIHFGIEEDFDAFVASGLYGHATIC